MCDECVEVFILSLWVGVYEYTYIVCVMMFGNFVVLSIKVEEMYVFEIFGWSVSDRVIVR